ncbi:hypothetical protein [Chondromyces crocatus]|uniref:hypothetical protein n=1 Tax=Chondromyces crocatus TaxID=52 RepID=UPI0012E2CA3B|nr:hypothetical protein [Chondromyces crocatus]
MHPQQEKCRNRHFNDLRRDITIAMMLSLEAAGAGRARVVATPRRRTTHSGSGAQDFDVFMGDIEALERRISTSS